MFGKRVDVAPIIAPPPLLFFMYLCAAWAADALFPSHWDRFGVWARIPCSVLAMALAASTGSWAIWAMARARTPVEPWHPTSAIVMEGPFGFTRNPLYLALSLASFSIALLANSAWFYASVPILVMTLHFGVVLPEEEYLLVKFGEPYLAYKKRVRRWL